MADETCEHPFVNTRYDSKGGVKVTCASCKANVTKPHHLEMAKVYRHD